MNLTPYEIVKQHFTLPFPLYEFQEDATNELAPLMSGGYYLDVGCVDADTEYLTTEGWKAISTYEGGGVGQYNLDGSVEFVKPLEYIKAPCAEMIRFKTKYGVDQLLSPEHRVLYVSGFGRTRETTAERVEQTYHNTQQGWKAGSFITTFTPSITTSLDLTDEQLRLQVAVMADGHFVGRTNRVQFRVKKLAKQFRIVELLLAAGVEFSVIAEDWEGCEGFLRYSFLAPWRVKEFDARFWAASVQQLGIISDEVLYWDGSRGRRQAFFTCSKQSADFVQYVFAAVGRRSTIRYSHRIREGRKDSHEYTVLISSGNSRVGMARTAGSPETLWREMPIDGLKYCFRVPSSYLILRRNGCIFATGNCGKTATATVSILYKFLEQGVQQCIAHMPPILLDRWSRWLRQVVWRDGRPLRVTVYRGDPRQRKLIRFDGDFVLMSTQIFKKDYDAIVEAVSSKSLALLVDEATSVKNVGTDNHKKTHDFAIGQHLLLLTGTPLSTPMDGYAFCKLVAPGIYRNLRQFENVHVASRDFFGNVEEWKNLDLLKENIKVNAVRVLKTDVLPNLPAVIYDPIFYRLDPAHEKLYKTLAEEQLLPLKDGGKIDKTQEQALVHALGQIIINYDYFADDPKCISRTIDLIEQIVSELDGRKLLVFANYRMSNRKLIQLLAPYGAVGAFGDLTTKQQQRNLDHFVNSDSCRVLCAQPSSVGYGVDDLQHVCHDVLYAETPTLARDFYQSLGRVWRDGQREKVHVRIAVAEGTLQVRKLKQLLANDELISKVQRSYADLRAEIMGE